METIPLHMLQNKLKRDPGGYKEEFEQQKRHYESALRIFKLQPSQPSRQFAELVTFLSHVIPCYPGTMPNFADELMDLLDTNADALEPDLRKVLVSALILLRNRGVIPPEKLLSLFFSLFKVQDKPLRVLLRTHIINDVCRINQKHIAVKTNAALENFLFGIVQGDHSIAAKESLSIIIELFRRNVWRDKRSSQLIASACTSPHSRVSVSALTFFIGEDEAEKHGQSLSDSEDEYEAIESKDHSMHSRGGKKKLRLQEKKGPKRKRVSKEGSGVPNVSAMQLLHDPQTLAEKLFSHVRKTTVRFERYMQPHQKYVTQILAIAAQSCHSLVPPDCVTPLIRQICEAFITERNTAATIAFGLNSVRIICSRTPLAMTSTLLNDLVLYKKYKDSGVMMAARSLLQLYRKLDPSLLHKKHRGKPGDDGNEDSIGIEFGKQYTVDGEDYLDYVASDVDSDSDGSDGSGSDSDSDSLELIDDSSEYEESESVSEGEGVSEGESVSEGEEEGESESESGEEGEESDEEEEEEEERPAKRRHLHRVAHNPDTDAPVVMDDITGGIQYRKAGKAGRLETMEAGKEDREGFGIAARKAEKGGGSTNLDKKKQKVYQMVRFGRRASQKRRQRNVRSFRSKTNRARQFKGRKAWKS